MALTRSNIKLWLLERSPIAELAKSRLPSNMDVLLLFFYHHRDQKKTDSNSVKAVISAVLEIWARANSNLATTSVHASTKLKALVQRYRNLHKNKNKTGMTYNMQRNVFLADMEDIFDVARSDVLDRGDILLEDEEFLISKRADRHTSYMGGEDRKYNAATMKRQERERALERAHRRQTEEALAVGVTEEATDSSSSTSSADSVNEAVTCGLKPSKANKHDRLKESLSDLDLTATWDREGLSVRQATSAFAATAKSLALGPDSVPSKSTVHRFRQKARTMIGTNVIGHLEQLPPRLQIHWDTKILTDIEQEGKSVDRIAVVVTGDGVKELLGAPKIIDGTGQQMASAVHQALTLVGIEDKIIGMVFDTTASNTGIVQGACACLEAALGRSLLWFACRHHVHEVILKDVFVVCLGTPPSPQIPLFRKFKEAWPSINHCQLDAFDKDEVAKAFINDNACLSQMRLEVIDYLRDALRSGNHPREDYEELLRLSLLYLGDDVGRYKLRPPGAYHQARWMAKGIYCLKIALLQSQFSELRLQELQGVRRMALFVSLV